MINVSEDTGKGVLRNAVTTAFSKLYNYAGYKVESPVITTSHPTDKSVTYNVSITVNKED